jgi:hypothetical protein
MPTFFRALLGIAALAMPLWLMVRAAADPPAVGRVIVLDNERLLEGEIERQGDQYCVRGAQGELVLPAAKVLKLCANRDEAFAFVAARADRRDPDERLRLARWCQLNGLYAQAVQEASAAVEMRPRHAESRQVLETVRRAAAAGAASPGHAPLGAAPVETTLAADVSLESLTAFSTRVQPVLMNTCVKCHSSGRGGHFSLTRAYDAGPVNRRATQQNLAAVLAQVDLEEPPLSPLLIKAVSAHGTNVQPPIHGQDAPPYRLLREWIEMTKRTNPHLWKESASKKKAQAAAAPGPRAELTAPEPKAQASEPGPAKTVATPAGPPPQAGPVIVSAPAAFEGRPPGTTEAPRARGPDSPIAPAAPPASAAPADEFDPALFNQRTPGH